MTFRPPAEFERFTSIDVHVAGEPLRVVTGGFPTLAGETILAKRRFARQHHDDLRRLLMLEPRGHADMYGCILTEPVTPDGDVGVLFLHNEGFSTMCGHGIIGLVKVGIEAGLLAKGPDDAVVRIDTPAGRVTATAHFRDDRVDAVSFRNVASFLLKRDLRIEVPGLGALDVDIAYGGAFYAYVRSDQAGVDIEPSNVARFVDVAMRIKRAVMEQYEIVHPAGETDLNFLYGTILWQERAAPGVHSRNVCVFAEGEVDRSPTGTGVSGRVAIHHARGELRLGEEVTIESVIGTSFDVRIAETTTVGAVDAIVPEVTGRAYVTGVHEFVVDPQDPQRRGFLVR